MKRFLFCILIVFFLSINVYAVDSVEILTGYLSADLKSKDDYVVIPLSVGLNFDSDKVLKKMGLKPVDELDFVVEPFFNTVLEPDKNIEFGSNFLMKYSFPVHKKFRPYVKGGLGMVYMTQHTYEQSTQYNFLPQLGGGFHIFLKENLAVTCEYRYRHLSNAS